MQGIPAAVAGACVAAVASALGTLAWIALARRWRLQDHPGQRRMHAQPTPRGGGVGLALGWWLGTFLACAWAGPGVVSPLPWLFAVTGGFLACGLLDDFSPLSAPMKLALQVLLAIGVFMPLLPADVRGNFLALSGLLLSFIYFVNAWNFMDGSNGMITLQALVIALAAGTWPGQDPGLALAALALAGACVGFLPLNFPRARVFLGDAGSLVLGSAVFLLLLGSFAVGAMSALEAALLASVFLLDTALTLARRILRGARFWRAHREHLYQFAIRKGHSHAKVALAYAGATGGIWLLALGVRAVRSDIVIIATPLMVWGSAAAAYFLLRRHWLKRGRAVMGVRG
jgi:UDP-N-acetylmuramyl pentapeptide phosphotransferase/UDP-N-acetylglucosamine-1-phosphate transferase